ncbi:MAG: hypothetical protein AAGM38_12105 [Pseudomonadota bacterium]
MTKVGFQTLLWRALALVALVLALATLAAPSFAVADVKGPVKVIVKSERTAKEVKLRSVKEMRRMLKRADAPRRSETQSGHTYTCTPPGNHICQEFATVCAESENCTGGSSPDGITCNCPNSSGG